MLWTVMRVMLSGKVNGVAGSLQVVFLLWGRRETTVFAGRGGARVCQPLLCHEYLFQASTQTLIPSSGVL